MSARSIPTFSTSTNCEDVTHRGLRNFQLEVSERLPQGYISTAKRSQRHCLLIDPSMSAVLIIETQKVPPDVSASYHLDAEVPKCVAWVTVVILELIHGY